MRVNTLVTLGASVAFGLMSIVLARGWIEGAVENEFNHKREVTPISTAPIYDTVPVLIADIALNFGDQLSRENVRLVDIAEDAVPDGAYQSFEDLFTDPNQQTVVLSRMAYNEPIIGFKISGPSGRGSLSALISEGMRATAIRVSDVEGVAGFILPGDYVDVIYTRDDPNGQNRNAASLTSDVILQNVRVLGIDQNLNNQSSDIGVVDTVTVEVSNADAQRLHLAMEAGRLSLTLRRVGEEDVNATGRITSKNITSAAPKASNPWTKPKKAKKITPPKPTDQVANITIIRGEDRNEVSVAMEGSPSTSADNHDLSDTSLAGG